jgi:hypothetical protein
MDQPKQILALQAKLSLLAELAEEFEDGLSAREIRLLRDEIERELAEIAER